MNGDELLPLSVDYVSTIHATLAPDVYTSILCTKPYDRPDPVKKEILEAIEISYF